MTIKLDDASIYTDFQGLDALRQSAETNSPEALEAVARQFEALFLQQLLKGMRDAQLAEGLLDSDAGDLYLDMYDKQISLNLAQGKGIGLADLLVEQLRANSATEVRDKSSDLDVSNTELQLKAPIFPGADMVKQTAPIPSTEHQSPAILSSAAQISTNAPIEVGQNIKNETPEQFLQNYWEPANNAAAELNIDVRIILAQTALETGWGKYITQHADGRSSHNLFNIKADQRWHGEAVSKQTLEFKDGIAQQEQSQFRAYDSATESFADYTQFLQQSPRYAQALSQGAKDNAAFIQGLQNAGYATDPDYADKVLRIADSDVMNRTLSKLKNTAFRPLTISKG